MKTTITLTLLLLTVTAGLATPYVPPDQITTQQGISCFTVPQVDATFNHFTEFLKIMRFEQGLQELGAGVNFGGEHEEEQGGQYYILETDNTLEAIWDWSRILQLTGDTRYNRNIANAWVYAYAWPAWQEGAGYYSAHNCAWGLAAERQYREATGDSSHWDYAVNSANYIMQTPLSFSVALNVMVTGWCCGNLYLYGEATSNSAYMDSACARARQIMTWVEQSPSARLSMESWAMSSGTFVWGICNSLFRRDPALGQSWLATYGPQVQVYEPTLPGWSNAWNVAYCNAQGAMFDVTGDSTYLQNHLYLTNLLLNYDQDRDGGIPSSAVGSQTADAAWTTSYLAMMGCNRYIGDNDAGVLMVVSPAHHATLQVGQPVRIAAYLGNWGTQLLSNVMVTVSGVYQDTQFVNLPVGRDVKVDFGIWTPTQSGPGSVTVTTHAPADSNSINDTDVSWFVVQANVFDRQLPQSAELLTISSTAVPMITLHLPAAQQVNLALYDLLGRRVQELLNGWMDAGTQSLALPINSLPSGVYFLRVQAGSANEVKKVVLIR
ncbi:MAG: T9SS type A sorting domain-containing protein [bacterium]|nr:T9SS type A sorting domain-containing protein [bacterium]